MTGPTEFERIAVSREADTITIRMINPARRNVLSAAAMAEITTALEDAASSDALGVVIAADGPVFSAGHDFADMIEADYLEARALFDVCTNMMTLVQRLPQVVIASVQGIATAAGCQLVATADLAVAAESAIFAAPGGKGGLFCHTPMVAIGRAVGRKRGLELALTGDPIDAATALSWGLVNRVVPDAELHDATLALLDRATRGSARSKAMGKASYYAQMDLPQAEAYEYASTVMSAGVTTPDAKEGMASFIEKRPPSWRKP